MIGCLIRCYHATDYLRGVLNSYKWVDKIVLLNYRFNSVEEVYDNTEQIAMEFNSPKLIFEKGYGLLQHGILNRGLEILKDCDLVFISDADEFIAREDQQGLIDNIGNHHVGCCKIIDYIYDYSHRFTRECNPIVIVRPNVRFKHIREVERNGISIIDLPYKLHHFGFVLPDDKWNWKMNWEGKEENVDMRANIGQLVITRCDVPENIKQLLPNSPR